MTIKCHEFFGCKSKHQCPMSKENDERNCWEVEPAETPCTNMLENLVKMEEKMVFCKNCLFYEHMNKTTK